MNWLLFIAGAFVGTLVGVFAVALCSANREAREMEALQLAHAALDDLAQSNPRARGYLAAYLALLVPDELPEPPNPRQLTMALVQSLGWWLEYWKQRNSLTPWLDAIRIQIARVEADR